MQNPTNCTTTEQCEIRIAGGNNSRLVEYVRNVEQYVDGTQVTGIHESSPLPAEFAVLVDSNGRRDVGELDDEQRAWLESESSVEVA